MIGNASGKVRCEVLRSIRGVFDKQASWKPLAFAAGAADAAGYGIGMGVFFAYCSGPNVNAGTPKAAEKRRRKHLIRCGLSHARRQRFRSRRPLGTSSTNHGLVMAPSNFWPALLKVCPEQSFQSARHSFRLSNSRHVSELRLATGSGAIAVARTMGARSFQSGSWRRSGRRPA